MLLMWINLNFFDTHTHTQSWIGEFLLLSSDSEVQYGWTSLHINTQQQIRSHPEKQQEMSSNETKLKVT